MGDWEEGRRRRRGGRYAIFRALVGVTGAKARFLAWGFSARLKAHFPRIKAGASTAGCRREMKAEEGGSGSGCLCRGADVRVVWRFTSVECGWFGAAPAALRTNPDLFI